MSTPLLPWYKREHLNRRECTFIANCVTRIYRIKRCNHQLPKEWTRRGTYAWSRDKSYTYYPCIFSALLPILCVFVYAMGPIRNNIQLPFLGNQAKFEPRVTISESWKMWCFMLMRSLLRSWNERGMAVFSNSNSNNNSLDINCKKYWIVSTDNDLLWFEETHCWAFRYSHFSTY